MIFVVAFNFKIKSLIMNCVIGILHRPYRINAVNRSAPKIPLNIRALSILGVHHV